MEVEKYHEMAEIQEQHWWFRGRRAHFCSLLEGLQLTKDATILELGCGTGANLSMLKQFGTVYAAEMDEFSRNYTREHSHIAVEYGRLPDAIPFPEMNFDLICMFDVLEHVEQDSEALKALLSRLNDNGRLLLSVPATKWLFGDHDKMFHHFRRYSRKELQEKIQRSGLRLSTISYFNTFLFPLAVFARLIDFVTYKNNSTGMATPTAWMNNLFYRIFVSERPLIKRGLLPFGLSLVAIATADDK
jgi:SAM-dependent methyltransferase